MGYEQTGPTTITDPVTGLQQSTAGKLNLTQIVEIGDDAGTVTQTSLPARNFAYQTITSYYEDERHTAVGNCGPAWNVGCLLWSKSYAGNSSYLASATNGMGLNETFGWDLARNNTHVQNGDPLYCNSHVSAVCNRADSGNWSHVVLVSRTGSVLPTPGGSAVTGTTAYGYWLAAFWAFPCSDCTVGYNWGDVTDQDYLDYYNGKFMGFAEADVTNPDGSFEVHTYYSTAGWGIYDCSQLSCAADNGTNHTGCPGNGCSTDAWWSFSNAAHGHEGGSYLYTDSTKQHLLHELTASFNPVCPPTRVQQTTGGSPANGYGSWDGQLVGELDPRNPISVCDVQATQSDDYMFDGQGSGALTTTDKTITYAYDNRGRISKQTTTSNDGLAGSATTLVRQPNYLTTDTLNHTSIPPVGSYVMDPRTFEDAEDGSGNRLSCSYMTYSPSVDLTESDRYASCGTSANSFNDKSGKMATTYGYDAYGNRVASTSPDGNAPAGTPGVSGSHTNCTTPAVSGTFSSCATFDSTFQALQTSQANAVSPTPQTATVDYPVPSGATGANGFGLWPQSTTDINGQRSAVAYDALGREISNAAPGETVGLATSTTAYANWCSGSAAQAPCFEVDRAQRLSSGTGGTYIPLPPTRICDTRSSNGTLCAGQTLRANTVTAVQVTGQGGVPNSDVAAVVFNAATLNSPGSGFLIAFPTGTIQPATSNLNYYAGQATANLIQVPVGTGGQISFFAGLSGTDLLLDVQGYVPQNWSGTAGLMNPLTPNARICDTRSASVTGYTTPCTGRTVAAGGSLVVQVTGQGGIPAAGVAAAILNVAVVNTTAPGALTVFATGQTQPGTSNVNWSAGQVIANRVVAPIGSGGQVTLVNQSAGTLDVIVDANAWVTDGSSPTATGAVYSAVTASRICDTRSGTGTGCSGQTLAAGAVLAVPVAGTAGIPAMGGPGAPQAVNINVTVANPSSSGALIVYPDGTTAPTTSDLNFAAQQNLANLDIVAAVGSNGKVDIYNRSGGTVDLIIDIAGYYGAGTSGMVTSRSFFDGWGNLVEIRAPGPESQHDVVRYRSYDKSNRLVAESVPYYVAAYAGPPGAAAFTNPDSTQATTSYTYDGIGRVLSTTDARGKATSTSYSIVCNAPQMDAYCYEQTLTVDPLGHRRGTAVDALGRIAYVQRYTGNSTSTYAVYATSSYTYDAAGNLLTIFHPTNAGQTTYTYDNAGRTTSVLDPDSGRTSFSYDPDGNAYQVVDARNTTGTSFIGYDNIDRPTWRDTQSSGATPFATFTYDAGSNGKGHLTGESFKGGANNSLSGTYTYTFDVRGRSTTLTLNISGQPYIVANGYDDAGNLISQTYPNQETVTTTLGATGWLSSVGTQPAGGAPTSLLSNPAYAYSPTASPPQFGGPAGQITSAVLGTNYQYSATYDGLLRSTDLKLASGATTYFDQQRAFDDAGNVTTATTTLPGGTDDQAFCYDEQDRLTWAGSTGAPPCRTLSAGTLTAANYTASFAYDRLGRLTSGPLGAYTYDPNHLHAASAIGAAYTAAYDAAGNMTCRAPSGSTTCVGTQTGAQLSYNTVGAMTAWQNVPNSPTATAGFLYDGEGNRVEQQVTQGGTTTTTIYIGNLEQVAITGGTTTTTTYYYASSTRIALAVGGVVSYLASDGLGSANVAIKAADSSTSAALFAPYGSVRYTSGTIPTDYGFTGQHADSATGLDYYNARYYDPLASQFTSADSALPGAGYDVWALSRYAYVQGNPEVRTDPSGHSIDNGPDKDILPQHVQTAVQAARNNLESLKQKLAEMDVDWDHLRTDKSKKEELKRHVNAIKRIKTRFSDRIGELRKIGIKIPRAAELADQIEAEAVGPMKFDPVTEYSLTDVLETEAGPAEPEVGRAPEAGGPRPEPGGGGRGFGGGLGGENVLKE